VLQESKIHGISTLRTPSSIKLIVRKKLGDLLRKPAPTGSSGPNKTNKTLLSLAEVPGAVSSVGNEKDAPSNDDIAGAASALTSLGHVESDSEENEEGKRPKKENEITKNEDTEDTNEEWKRPKKESEDIKIEDIKRENTKKRIKRSFWETPMAATISHGLQVLSSSKQPDNVDLFIKRKEVYSKLKEEGFLDEEQYEDKVKNLMREFNL
jgi:hypothetical protein